MSFAPDYSQGRSLATNLQRHLDWLQARHQQSAGAARNVRQSANREDSSVLADQKRKAADGAAINAAHYHEIREVLVTVIRLRKVLDAELLQAVRSSGLTEVAYRRFVSAVDNALGFGPGGQK